MNQYGFRSNHSTYMAVIDMYNKITQALDENKYAVGIFIDLSKAFDTVNHSILLNKHNIRKFSIKFLAPLSRITPLMILHLLRL